MQTEKFQMHKLGLEKAEKSEKKKKKTNILWITEKARGFQRNIYFCFIDYTKAFHCVDHNKFWTILKEI